PPAKQLKVRYEVIEQNQDALEGRATRKQIAAYYGDAGYRIDILLYVPKKASAPSPVFLGLNFNGNHTIHADDGILKQGSSKQRGAFADRWQVEMLIDRGY
ncbi:MAG TPA: acetylxylan esterase, partial [Rhodopirellula sp.]|nr:acetylxylan esterase [Rhodopirellula sp.]